MALNLSRRSQGKLDMVTFWKEIAQKVIAPTSRLMSSDVIHIAGPPPFASILDEVLSET
jgi:hypothetical protein